MYMWYHLCQNSYSFILCHFESAVFAKFRNEFTKSTTVFTKVVVVFRVDKISPLYHI